jgi:hypothetical protein
MEGNTNSDEVKDLNNQLEQTYFAAVQQLLTKLA